MYTDVHCHLLPGVDDGCPDWDASKACLDRCRSEKVRAVLVTPHIWPDKYPNRPAELRERFAAWSSRAAGLGLQLALGAEVYYHHGLPEDLAAGKLLTLGGGPHLLVEFPVTLQPRGVDETFYRLRLAGAEPLLAHPERYVFAQRDPRRLAALAESGIAFQVTTHSLVGTFGPQVQRTAFQMLERGWVALVASDAHRPDARPPLFREAVRVLERRYGRAAARRLAVQNPRRVFEGLQVHPVPCALQRRGLFG